MKARRAVLKILFVCTGNTCRSPMAAAIFNREAALANLSTGAVAYSAGLAASPGDSASANARNLMQSEGIPGLDRHRAMPLSAELVERSELIFVMTLAQKCELINRFPGAEAKVHLLKEFSGDKTADFNLEDPFSSGPEKYREVMEEIRRSVKKLIIKLKEGR